MARRGLATKLSLAIAVVVVVSVGAMSLLAVSMSRQSLRDQVSSANRTAASLAARAVEQYLAAAVSIMREASGRPKLSQEVRTGNWTEAGRVLENFLQHFPQFDYVFVQDPQGVIRVRIPHAPTVGQDFSHRDFFQEAIRTRALYVSGVYVSQAAQRPVVSIAVPVVDHGETVKGVLVGALSLKAMSEVVSAIGKDDGAQLYVVDRKGMLVARSNGTWDASQREELTSLPIVQAVLAGRTGTMGFTDPGSREVLLGAHVPIASLGWGVVGTKPVSTAFAPADRLSRWLLGIALACAALAVVLGWRLARALTGPLARLASATDRVATGDFSVRVAIESRDEVAALAASFNHMAEHLEQTQARLVQSEKVAAMGSLLAGVAHELNNPLAVLTGQATLLAQTVKEGPLAQRAEKIVAAAQRCARIVRNFLSLARKQAPERREVSLNLVVQEAVELLAYELRTENVEVVRNLADGLPTLWGDGHRLHQILVNLIANAAHAMRQAPGARRLTVTTRRPEGGGRVQLEVADTGPGIPAELQARIFEPFFTTKPAGEGTGLGLSLCRGIVEEHGGTITVTSEPGRGAAFLIEIPAAAPSRVDRESSTPDISIPTEPKTVLVVDDEPEVAELLAEILLQDGHRVDSAANGAIALEKLATRQYDLVICDTKMPVLDGVGFFQEAERRLGPLRGRIIFLTGDTLAASKLTFLEDQGLPLLTKPFEVADVLRAVRRVLAEQPAAGRRGR